VSEVKFGLKSGTKEVLLDRCWQVWEERRGVERDDRPGQQGNRLLLALYLDRIRWQKGHVAGGSAGLAKD
jgi:hypothetical protein